MKCSFSAGVSIYKTSETEVVASGNSRTIILEGPAATLLRFLGLFSEKNDLDLDTAISEIVHSSEGIDRADLSIGLREVSDQLLTSGIFVTKESVDNFLSYKKAVFLVHSASVGIIHLLSNFPSNKNKLCVIDNKKYKFDEIKSDVKSNSIKFPGWEIIESLVSPICEDTILVAIGLSNAELHKLNKAAVDFQFKWIYAAFSGNRIVVSAIHNHRKSPCFACARLRRLGSVDDIISGSILEANLMKNLPMYQTIDVIDDSVDLMLAGVIIRKSNVKISDSLHLINKTTLEVSEVFLTKLVDCPICGGIFL